MPPEAEEDRGEREQAPEASSTVYPLGKYMVLAELGRGGMAEVYLGLSRGPSGFSKLVVLKLLRAHLAEDDDFLQMFLAEARLAARLNHANIVQTYEIGVEGGRHCIVMEYLEGCSMAQLQVATRQDGIPINVGVRILADTLAGLHHAHERCDVNGQPLGLVHRDVSPHNVFVTHDGQVKVLDFGIAKASDDGARTKTGVFKGKIRYTAPERFCGEESDRRADIFSVGVVLWQLLTKKHLWSGMSELALMQQLASRTPIQSPRSLDPTVPEELDAICMKAIAMSPADRYDTAAEMQDALEEFLSTDPGATNRALGRFMGEQFGELRARFQRVVDDQVRAAASVPLDLELTASVARVRAQGVPLLTSGDGPYSLSSASRLRGTGVGNRDFAAPDVQWVGTKLSAAPPPRRRPFAAWVLVGLLALSSCVVAFILKAERLASTESAPSSPASLSPSSSAMAVLVPAPDPQPTAPSPPAEVPEAAAGSATAAKRVPTPPPPLSNVRFQAVRSRPVSSSNESHSATAVPEAEPQRREVDCSSPYYIDEQGMKKIRTECL